MASAVIAGDMNYWYAPAASTLKSVRAFVVTASSNGGVAFDLLRNGSSLFSTLLTIDQGETNSLVAQTNFVFSSVSLSANDTLTARVVTAGTGAVGPQIQVLYTSP
jgi:hypothetical protein